MPGLFDRRYMWGEKPYHSLDYEIKKRYGSKLYKLALDGGFTCPNRDGKLGTRGCIFCSAGGSGDFTPDRSLPLSKQISLAKDLVSSKYQGEGYIAYFQAFTGTYGPIEKLRSLYTEVMTHPEIRILDIATRPDCLDEDVLSLLEELNLQKPVWVELGLQTMHEKTAAYIRRGYELDCFERAVHELHDRGIEIIVHVILGLPGEDASDMVETVKYLNTLPIQGIKFQLLHVLQGTDLNKAYEEGKFEVLTLDEYTSILLQCIVALRPDIVVHRITGDGPKKLLTEPKWSANKKKVLGHIHHQMKLQHILQGSAFKDQEDWIE